MPLLYGEGETKVFLRLQSEILKVSSDDFIFAWKNLSLWSSGLLVHSPRDFADSGDIRAGYYRSFIRRPVSITGLGLEIELPVGTTSMRDPQRFDEYPAHHVVPLDCCDASNLPLALPFRLLEPPGSNSKTLVIRALRTDVDRFDFITRAERLLYRTQTRQIHFVDNRNIKIEDHQLLHFSTCCKVSTAKSEGRTVQYLS